MKNAENSVENVFHEAGQTPQQAQEIANNLPGSQVKWLRLSDSPIGNEGAMALACVLNETQIERLDLYNCNIGVAGALALIDSLAANTSLKALFIHKNNFAFYDKIIFQRTLSALTHNTTLTQLSLQAGNSTRLLNGQAALDLLNEFTQKNTSVRFILMNSNCLTNLLERKVFFLNNRNISNYIKNKKNNSNAFFKEPSSPRENPVAAPSHKP